MAAEVQSVEASWGRVERFSPAGQPLPGWTAEGPGGTVRVGIDGYLLINELAPERGQSAHLEAFAKLVEMHDLGRALESVVAGSFVLVIAHIDGRVAVVTDALGTIPLYSAETEDGWLVSTNPVVLAGCPGVDRTPDRTGLASWALIGYTLGNRYLVRGIRVAPAASIIERLPDGQLKQRGAPLNPFEQQPGAQPTVGDLTAAFRRACARLAAVDEPTAHLQSAGMDSRLILASWPADLALPCYGYGDPQSSEVRVARQLAAVRGSPYRHVAPDGDAVAAVLDEIFAANGLLVYPDRYLIAKEMAAAGYRRVLDGFAGGIMLGGHFYAPPRSLGGSLDRLRARFRDQPIHGLSMEAMARTMYEGISELPNPAELSGLVAEDFLVELEGAREDVLADIEAELVRLRPRNDSAGVLVRNFTMANRSAHAVVQQGVMSRRGLTVGYPYSGDADFLLLSLHIAPERAAFRRLQIELIRTSFPAYAAVPLGTSLIPLRRAPPLHQISGQLVRRGLYVPGLSGRGYRSANNWQRWLRESAALREALGRSLRAGGIDAPGLEPALAQLATGERRAWGKLMHLAAIGRWLGPLPE